MFTSSYLGHFLWDRRIPRKILAVSISLVNALSGLPHIDTLVIYTSMMVVDRPLIAPREDLIAPTTTV